MNLPTTAKAPLRELIREADEVCQLVQDRVEMARERRYPNQIGLGLYRELPALRAGADYLRSLLMDIERREATTHLKGEP